MHSKFPNEAAEFVYTRTYSRWRDDLGRRETWFETVDRYIEFIRAERGDKIPQKVLDKAREYILKLDVLPSMRLLWSAGEAARVENTSLYNCAAQSIDSVEAFGECLYILCCGAGYGFSVEKKHIEKLPIVPKEIYPASETFVIDDSKKGWADSIKALMNSLYSGKNLDMDYTKIRPRGSRLKTMGGRASGSAPLMAAHNFIKDIFGGARERKLKPIECHDILNKIAEIVVSGGVRRSSELSLSDFDDEEMRNAKTGHYPMTRAMSNNSSVYYSKPPAIEFLKEWSNLAASGTGERGIFNLEGGRKRSPERRDASKISGTNACGEILLRGSGPDGETGGQFCNLSSVIVRPNDDLDSLLEKVECGVWLGIIQATFTHFPYLSKAWTKNCEEERLLGVSLSGQMDNPKILTPDALTALKSRAIKVAKKASHIMGINMPAAITCVKPEGNSSQVSDAASGIHPRYAPYYIRRYRISGADPLFRLLKDSNIHVSPENGQRKSDWKKADKGEKGVCIIYVPGEEWSEEKVRTWVVSFPAKSPKHAITRNELTAIDQLEQYRKVQTYWCEHSTSCTVYVRNEEWFQVGNWVYENWDLINGISFLPFSDHKYEQAPYEEISKEEYEKMVKAMPIIDYSKLHQYEADDNTEGAKTLACGGGSCEII